MRITVWITKDNDYAKCVQHFATLKCFVMAISLAQMDAKDMKYAPIDGRADLS